MKIKALVSATIALLLTACSGPSVPTDAVKSTATPNIFPDYTEVTVPSNICPLNFMMKDCDEVVARLTVGNESYTYGEANKVVMDESEWATLRNAAKGKSITVEVYGKKGTQWTAYKPFNIYVAEEEIDPYLSYRLIQPSYVTYNSLSIEQRNIASFEVSDIYNNQLIQTNAQEGQCINCHSYKNYGTKDMLFHARQTNGGTMIVHDGNAERVDLKTDSTISAGVYPAWHPTEDLVAFSTNTTRQSFHTNNKGKIEVFDVESDLILYDVKTHTVSHICNDPQEFEVFPAWAPDGKTLYYCSAHFEYRDTLDHGIDVATRSKEIKYSIYKRAFNPQTRQFGEAEMVFDAAGMNQSATLPRLSPDGRYLTFSLGNYGCFHVWHKEADIVVLDLLQPAPTDSAAVDKTPTVGLNSTQSESYPSFSSNGRWMMTASRGIDGCYTRPFIAYFDKSGKCRKGFVLPQKDPEFYTLFTRSFNRPEFMKESVGITPQTFAEKFRVEAVKAKYKK